MTTHKNTPDRFKLILQFIVFSLGGGLLLLLISMFGGFFAFFPHADFGRVLLSLLLISVSVNAWRFVVQWKKLRVQEESGETPDYQNPKNIKPFQVVILCVEIPLVVAGYAIYELSSKFAGQVCYGVAVVIAVLEIVYLRLYRKPNQNTQPGR
ncbi:hypothetical protein [Geomesophilobacter sediminis]|uniref:DUF2178 domain-containing protein n=1 Tax=Geomesophilobacter sediminis TaxID=2798584 RepID=A0A8J7M2N2_9BACT|nr:hypothetical protein [Geomesophilobacter sediminis]MBJ6727513.1 hypothetical protein [Geomesophilobacter sediminis]